MKKDGIQTRNRKTISKGKKKKEDEQPLLTTTMPIQGWKNCDTTMPNLFNTYTTIPYQQSYFLTPP